MGFRRRPSWGSENCSRHFGSLLIAVRGTDNPHCPAIFCWKNLLLARKSTTSLRFTHRHSSEDRRERTAPRDSLAQNLSSTETSFFFGCIVFSLKYHAPFMSDMDSRIFLNSPE